MSDKLVEASEKEVAMLIAEATNPYNLAQMYSGWDPWW
jgi:phosphatidylinositol kinase/protein kinase (PI-3  family)